MGASRGGVQLPELARMFRNLEKYITFDLTSRRDKDGPYRELLWWTSAGEAGMDHAGA